MQTLTEFSGSIIRTAGKRLAELQAALPPAPPPPAPPPVEVPVDGAPVAPAADAETANAAAPVAPAADAEAASTAAPVAPAADAEATNAAIDAALSQETGIKGDRLARLREALEAVGGRAADVRLVRVYAGEEAVPSAKRIGAHQYLVDLMPESMKQISSRPEKPRGGRGDRDRGPKRAEGSLSGRFSMDSLKSDRGAGRRGPGGPPKS